MVGPSRSLRYYGFGRSLLNKTCITAPFCSFGTRFALRPPFNRSPRVRTQTFSPSTCQIYSHLFRIVSGFALRSKLTHSGVPNLLPSSGQRFTASFIQIPPREGHPLPLVNTSYYQGAFGTPTLEFAPKPGALSTKMAAFSGSHFCFEIIKFLFTV
jgi:hypothetical protein